MSGIEKPARERWGSKIAFIMAAVGFAVSQLLSPVLALVCFDERDCFPNKVFIYRLVLAMSGASLLWHMNMGAGPSSSLTLWLCSSLACL